MRVSSILKLAGVTAVMASAVPAVSQAQVRVSIGLGRFPARSSVGYYSRYSSDLFSGIYLTGIQQERLDEVSAEFGYQDPLRNSDELWAMRQVLGPGERLVFDDNVEALRGPAYAYGPVYNPEPWYIPGRVGVRIGSPRTVIVPRTVVIEGRDRDGRDRGVERVEHRDGGFHPERAGVSRGPSMGRPSGMSHGQPTSHGGGVYHH